jgi:hypothetical protein
MSIVVKRKLFVLYYLVVVIISLRNPCYLVVSLCLDDRRSCCCRPCRSSPRLTILRAIVRWRLDCSRYVPIVFVVATLYVELTLFLWHHLLLWPVELSLIMITISALVYALVCESSQLPTGRVKLLLVGVFVVQLPDKRRHCGVDCGTIDLGT